jgi:hypothetical protein
MVGFTSVPIVATEQLEDLHTHTITPAEAVRNRLFHVGPTLNLQSCLRASGDPEKPVDTPEWSARRRLLD